jgi:arsenate reductase (glutaredoxin)
MPITIYGIKNCDTMKKAFAWLDAHGIAYTFHDYKKLSVTKAQLTQWCHAAGWEKVLNRAGPTFRKLPDASKENLTQTKAITLMLTNPSMIKRPILEIDGVKTGTTLEIAFKPARYATLFGPKK